ncbi:MAG: hypothetical protein K2N63_07485, partial [Lachnospiraceae bacterium]|nr:hypothetical protein [Lachnospiraceae bacterium]
KKNRDPWVGKIDIFPELSHCRIPESISVKGKDGHGRWRKEPGREILYRFDGVAEPALFCV